MNYQETKVPGRGKSWEVAKLRGFKHRIHINIDLFGNENTVAGYPANQIFTMMSGRSGASKSTMQSAMMGYLASQQHPFERRRENRLRFQGQIRTILGAKDEDWRVKGQNDRDKRMYLYTKDLEWMVVARLLEYQELLDNILKIETLEE